MGELRRPRPLPSVLGAGPRVTAGAAALLAATLLSGCVRKRMAAAAALACATSSRCAASSRANHRVGLLRTKGLILTNLSHFLFWRAEGFFLASGRLGRVRTLFGHMGRAQVHKCRRDEGTSALR